MTFQFNLAKCQPENAFKMFNFPYFKKEFTMIKLYHGEYQC